MNELLIISDLHLSAQRPETLALFQRFLEERPGPHSRLYILGDLFDAWIGDDDNTPPAPSIKQTLRRCSDRGCEIFLMHGNRDFLIGERFAAETGVTLLDDPAVVHMDGHATLLMHGDLLCSDDVEYQKVRAFLRSPGFINDILAKDIAERLAIAAEFRRRSGEVNSLKADDIMDVNQGTVEEYMRNYQVTRLIHGHTHRPARHRFTLDGQPAERIVLAEWHADRGSCLRCDEQGIETQDFI